MWFCNCKRMVGRAIYGYDFTIDDIVWMGPQSKLEELALKTGTNNSFPLQKLEEHIGDAVKKGRKIHFLPQYRPENIYKIYSIIILCHEEPQVVKLAQSSQIIVLPRSVQEKMQTAIYLCAMTKEGKI